MLLLGFRLDNDLKLEFENNFENDLVFVENIMSFMEAIKSRKFFQKIEQNAWYSRTGMIKYNSG